MHVSFSLPDLLRLFKHLRGSRVQGILAHSTLRVTAMEGQIFLENPQLAAGVEALVLEPGAFTFSRLRFHALLKGFSGRERLTLQAGPEFLQVGTQRLKLRMEGFEPRPRLPAYFEASRFRPQKVPSTVLSAGSYKLSFGDPRG
jgi:hypothetical protein